MQNHLKKNGPLVRETWLMSPSFATNHHAATDLKKRSIIRFMVGLLATFLVSAQVDGQTPSAYVEQTIQSTMKQVRPTIVTVGLFIDGTSLNPDPFSELKQRGVSTPLPVAIGSGVVLKWKGTTDTTQAPLQILTCAHLVAPRGSKVGNKLHIAVHFPEHGTFAAELTALDPRSNLAIIALDQTDGAANKLRTSNLIGAEIAEKIPAPGDEVIFAGNGLAMLIQGSASITSTTITRTNSRVIPSQQTSDDTRIGSFLQLESASSPGSGSPVFNQVGELIGLTTEIPVLTGSSRSTINVIPVGARFERIVLELEQGFEVDFGFLGLSPESAAPNELDALRPAITQPTCAKANRVSSQSPAEIAGVKSGDLILSVDGIPVLDQHDLIRETSLAAPDSEVTLSIWRPRTRQRKQIAVTLGKSPVHDERAIFSTQARYQPWRGLQVDYSTSRRKYLPNRFLSEYPPGVVITSVMAESPSAMANLRPGQFITKVNGTTIDSPKELFDEVGQKPNGNIELTLSDGTKVSIKP